MNLNNISMKILEKRYLIRDEYNNIIETPEEMLQRVVDYVCGNDEEFKKSMFDIMDNLMFLPNTPTLMNAGLTNMLSACFVIPVFDSLESIVHDACWQQAAIHKTGGGVGLNYSNLRPNGDLIKTTGGVTSGVLSFLKLFDRVSDVIHQGGKRNGANMGILNIDHPEIEDFIRCKVDNKVDYNNFNLSVMVTGEFMYAVKFDIDWDLKFNDKTYKTVKAVDLFNMICESAWSCGCPGIIFEDTINKNNKFDDLGMHIINTNPCVIDDTWIMTTEGPRQVKDLIGNEPFVSIVNGSDNFFCDEFVSNGFFYTGTKDVYKLKTKNGYSIITTKDHLFRVRLDNKKRDSYGSTWKKLEDLNENDDILFSNNTDINEWEGWGYDYQGYLVGSIIGDGTFSNGTPVLASWSESEGDKNVRNKITDIVSNFCGVRSDFNGWKIEKRPEENDINRKYVMNFEIFRKFTSHLGVFAVDKKITPMIEKTSSDFYKGFIRGFFDTDGTVVNNIEKGISVRLYQHDLNRLEAVQRMLARFGIMSIIYEDRKPEGIYMLPDSNRNLAEYNCKAGHELVISKDNVYLYHEKIGFYNTDKMKKLEDAINLLDRGLYKERYVDKIDYIDYIGKRKVYDCSVDIINMFDGNGFILHNCGEQPLYCGHYEGELIAESCNLGSINLSKFVNESKEFDYIELKRVVNLTVEFLDMIIDVNKYPFDYIDKGTKLTRKIGLGVTGFSDMLIKMNVSYNSKYAVELASNIMKVINDESHITSHKISEIKGLYPLAHLIDDNKRNASITTIAPTGTIGRLMIGHGYALGIEPPFALSMTSYIIETSFDEGVHPLLVEKLNELGLNHLIERIIEDGSSIQHIDEIPEEIKRLFVTSHEIPLEQHLEIQSAFQKHTDNAVSKTINLSSDATVDDFKKAYLMAHDLGCKGVTIFRDMCKGEQVMVSSGGKLSDIEIDVEINNDIELDDIELDTIQDLIPRSKILPAVNFVKKTGCNTMFITLTKPENSDGVLECFINTAGKGGCQAMQDGLAIAISVYQRYIEGTVGHKQAVEALSIVSDHLLNIDCKSSILKSNKEKYDGIENIDSRSCPNAVAQVIKIMLNGELDIIKNENDINPVKHLINTILEDVCPDCGCKLIKQEGCQANQCMNCGYGGCS